MEEWRAVDDSVCMSIRRQFVDQAVARPTAVLDPVLDPARAGHERPARPGRPEPVPAAEAFVVELARALHERGIPSHRLEASVSRVAARLGLAVQVFSVPTSVQIAFEGPDGQRSTFLRADAGEVDLARIARLNELIDGVLDGRVTAEEGRARLGLIASQPPAYPAAFGPLAYGVASAGACRFFGGGPSEVLASAFIGGAVGAAALLIARRPSFTRLFEPVAALVAAVLAAALAAGPFGLASDVVTLSALIVLVPGFTLTVAMSELAERHLSSGTARLAGAATTFLVIGLGIGIGRKLALFLGGAPGAAEPHGWLPPFDALSELGALLTAPLAFAVLFQARRRDLPWILPTTLLGYFGARAGSVALGPELGVFVGALTVGAISNALARWRGHPVSITQVPGIMLLVPGSIGYRSVSFFLAQDVLSGMEAAFRMALVAVALVGGILFANVLVAPRREL